MELPFAVESPSVTTGHITRNPDVVDARPGSNFADRIDDGSSSLVTASSQGSMSLSEASYDPIPASAVPSTTNDGANLSGRSCPPSTTGHSLPADSRAYGHELNTPRGLDHTQKVPAFSSQDASVQSSAAPPLSDINTVDDSARGALDIDTNDFTYVNVCETDEDEVDILITGGVNGDVAPSARHAEVSRGDILAVLLSGRIHEEGGEYRDDGHDASDVEKTRSTRILALTEKANRLATEAARFKMDGNMQKALDAHVASAKCFRDASLLVKDSNASMANSFLLLCQTQARTALALRRIANLRPLATLTEAEKMNGTTSQKERLRATLRGALENQTEADISDSVFLGKASKGKAVGENPTVHTTVNRSQDENVPRDSPNPVDDMMELERELRNMDMALEMGNSIASLDARTQQRMRNSVVDGSFMVVPPGSNSFMSTSTQWSAPTASSARMTPNHASPGIGTAGMRARANRVQSVLESTSAKPISQTAAQPVPSANRTGPHSLDSSWWGNSSVVSQALNSSVISLASGTGADILSANSQPTDTKQLMRLMDTIKTLGDENAALLREVEEAEAARREAKSAKEEMKRFKQEYGKRFAALKEALEKFRKGYPSEGGKDMNPVTNSQFARSASTSDQLTRQEQLIKKLTADLKKEKEEGKKKDAALRKYESFYREVKARSAQKAAQRQKDTQQRQQHPRNLTRLSK